MEDLTLAGARFDVSAAGAIVSGPGEPVTGRPVLFAAPGDTGVPQLALLLTRGGAAGPVRLEGRITVQEAGFDSPLHQFLLGSEYAAPLLDTLGRLLGQGGAGDPAGRSGTPGAPGAGPAPEHMEQDGVPFTVTTGRPGLDGRLVDRVETTLAAADFTAEALVAAVRLTVAVAARRAAAGDFLRGRSFRLAAEAPSSSAAATGRSEDVRLDDLGGLDDVVAQLRDVADSFRHPEIMARWGARRPQGILMWGPPGTGKTTLARALANEIGGSLKEIRTPDILDRWMGASERNIARVFADARGYTEPTVLLFDEFDSIVSYAGEPHGSADQAINSVAGIFKQEMNTLIESNPNVIVVATTNFPGRVDESLIRSGRFDVKLGVPRPGSAARADILAKLIAGLSGRHASGGFRMFADDVSVAELGEAAVGLTGADLREVLRRAQLEKAMAEARGRPAGPITQADLLTGIARLTRASA